MLRGLQGRRIALAAIDGDADAEQQLTTIRGALVSAGAQVDTLSAGGGSDEDWHSARYAGLVLVGDAQAAAPKLSQLVREFSVSEKPIAASGSAIELVKQAGGEPRVSGHDDTGSSDFAARVVTEFSDCLEDRDLDEMSDESFPASDPPATTPVSRPTVDTDPQP